ncbi:pyrroloquinoline quinone biosynthesis protein PqqE [Actinomycetospora sp. OC33-EN08]|uniref:PqqA peptide cyclase n=1 Tax=Actinomycetospora aurantiaca TaxID=3129233 RepID=A0ABU8MVA9_9PSEU
MEIDGPLGLLAELTYRCPLACAYCSNPTELAAYRDELDTAEWQRVITEAAELGALQCHLSGGEPLLRRDLADLVRTAAEQGLYTNLVTSALGFTEKRAAELHDAGLDHVQVSLQADEPALSDRIAGLPSFRRKIEAARRVRELGWPLTLNVVLHRQNIDRIPEILAAAEELEADRIELANTQYYGWAALNRAALLPSREQLAEAEVVVREAKERLRGRMEIIYVIPDYYATYPKPCMGGWGARQLVVVPTGDALPCLAAHGLPLPSANVREHDLAWIWQDSPMFSAYRGTDWMQDPCRSCSRREVDLGGCRCQAFALTGDATRTDPVCHLSPDHGIVEAAVAEANEERTPVDLPLVPRRERQRN